MTYGAAPYPQVGFPQPPPRGQWRLPLIVISIAVVVAVAAVVSVYVLTRPDQGADRAAGGPVEGQLRTTYPTEPSAGWRLDADEVFDGAAFVRPDSMAFVYQAPGFLDFGDVLVTAAILPQTDKEAELVGIDSATGEVLWRNSDVGFKPVCAERLIDGLLACIGKEATFSDRTAPTLVSFLGLSSGIVDHQVKASDDASMLLVNGPDLYTVGYGYMARGTSADLTSEWEQRYPNDGDDGCVGSGDSQYYDVNDDVVYFGSDAGVVMADARTGRQLTDRQPQFPKLFADKGFASRSCNLQSAGIEVWTEVYDTAGDTLRRVESDAGAAWPWLVEDQRDVPLVVGDTAYDFESGDRLWTATGDDVAFSRIVGDVVIGSVSAEGADGYTEPVATVGYDVGTGERLWSSPVTGSVSMSDGERVMIGESEDLTAVNLRTGEREWALPGVSAYGAAPAGEGFAVAEPEAITFYPPTGGPSVAPGATVPEASEPSGGGGLITKCGRTPEMRPVEYRAENGALVVKMEIKARCPGGDIVSTDRLRITVRDGDSIICSGVFDFSGDPLVLEGEGAEPTVVDLTFGDGTILRHPNTLGPDAGGSGDPAGTTSAPASGDELVDCEDEGVSRGPDEVDDGPHLPSGDQTKTTGGPACVDAEALDAMRVQVDSDRPFVQARLADRWIAQLSAKRPGLVAPDVDGGADVTWAPCQILQQHLRLRLKYPEVRLVWSDEWRTFDLRGWWVTFAGLTFAGPDEANAWCDQRSIPVDECFAKVVSNTRDSSGSTKYRR